MPLLLSAQGLTKSFGARPLFRDLSLGISDGERIGLVGPNGSGKSTLLRILAGLETPDAGSLSRRSGLRWAYVAQEDALPPQATVDSVLRDALAGTGMEEYERAAELAAMVARVGFPDPAQACAALSGGWRKRLAIARALIQGPDLLLLDEPTNHLDLEGILWLEETLARAPFGLLMVSHDRAFLECATNRTMELNPAFPDGALRVEGPYSALLERKEGLLAAQEHQQVALENRVRREIEWLRRMPQARATKAQGRIDQAHALIGDLAELKRRNTSGRTADIDFTATRRATRELLVTKEVGRSLGGRALFQRLDLTLSPGDRLGLIGPNGSGKSTLLSLLAGRMQPDTGSVRRADGLRIVLFDQQREELDPAVSLRRTLAPDGDTVMYQGSAMHVAGWAKRFLFDSSQLERPIGTLSGGEKARVLLARLMLRPADLLILDEPTNDLDIPTLEALEDSLREFPGALVLVTHDRMLLDRVSTELLALDGRGGHAFLAEVAQWETLRREQQEAEERARRDAERATKARVPEPAAPARLSASERRELEKMEARITAAEDEATRLGALLADPAVASDAARLHATWQELEAAKARVDQLYARWQELEGRR